jgi:hypothetical protein
VQTASAPGHEAAEPGVPVPAEHAPASEEVRTAFG